MPMDKRLLRLALVVQAELAQRRSPPCQLDLPTAAWDRCRSVVRRMQRAKRRGWYLAAAVLQHELAYELSMIHSELSSLATGLPEAITPPATSAGDICHDLVALTTEFAAVDFDIKERRLSVTTEAITLENLYLGPFEIRWHWNHSATPYRVVAVDPQPAASRDNVTHPHVMDEQLCEGESHVAIREALSQGRLLDFFTLVANGLRSYNADSPFVAIDAWYGGRCSDCGYGLGEDEGYTCETCNEAVCNDCEVTCNGCDRSYCSQCTTLCCGCDDGYCRGCLSFCADCRQPFCPQCLPENERCSNCHEQQAEKAEASIEIQSPGLGQAALSAGRG